MKILLIIASLCLISCSSYHHSNEKLSSLIILDHNGFSETIQRTKALQQYKNIDFSSPQPYKKIVVNKKNASNGSLKTTIYTYYDNGQTKQLLECREQRALGEYKEWHPNGKRKLAAHIVGGDGNISLAAEKSWLFDGTSFAWDENENLMAKINYKNGLLNGSYITYHTNGNIKERSEYLANKIDKIACVFYKNGVLSKEVEYNNGTRHGCSKSYNINQTLSSKELYNQGLLKEGLYFGPRNNPVGEIVSGSGKKYIYFKDGRIKIVSYQNGVANGLIQNIGPCGHLQREYYIKGDVKNGPETLYYPDSTQPQTTLPWFNGSLQGVSQTWYKGGQKESSKEISNNKRNGISMIWYHDGSLMMIEEYENDHLKKGSYHKIRSNDSVSLVKNGSGFVTLFDPYGNFIRKIEYYNGNPSQK